MRKAFVVAILAASCVAGAQETTKPSAAIELKRAAANKAATPDEASAPASVTSEAKNQLALATGTAVKMKLETSLNTAGNKAGDVFSGRVTEPVMQDGKTVIPVGASIQGHVTKVAEPRRIKGLPSLNLRPDTITMPDGQRFDLNAVVVDTNKANGTEVNDEGEIQGPGHSKGDLIEMGAGTAGGMTLGAVAGGAKGAFIGAVIGGGATAIHWLTKRKSADLPAGTEIVMEISRPLSLSASGGASK